MCVFPIPGALPDTARLVKARNGEPSLTLNNKYVHSAYDPGREAEYVVSPFREAEAGVLIGYGLGYVAAAWMRERPRPLFIVELIPGLLAQETANENLLALAPCCCVSGTEIRKQEEYFTDFLRGLGIQTIKKIAWMETPGITAQAPALAKTALRFLKQAFEAHLTNIYTELEFERLWFRNILRNAFLVPQAKPFAALRGILRESAVVIIGAGPSLDDEIATLREIRKRSHAVLMACDTALPSLLLAEIAPDIVVSLDGQIHNFHDFCGCEALADMRTIFLICDVSVYHTIPRLPFGEVYFFETADIREIDGRQAIISHPLTLRIKQICGELGVARSGGNVGTTALELARVMGARLILFSGMDYAYPGGVSHARASAGMTRLCLRETRTSGALCAMHKSLRSRALCMIPDNQNNVVASDIILRKYADWTAAAYLEAKDAGDTAPAWYTLSGRGAEIPGVRCIGADEALDLLAGFSPPPGDVFRAHTPSPESAPSPKMLALLQTMRDLERAITEVLGSARPLPDPAQVLQLLEFYPYLRRGYGAQLMHTEKTGDVSFLLGEVHFQLERILKILRLNLTGKSAG
ncbi:MAG: DUF115 domain-containing protein [Spirochaetota bacterium]|nr:DUF115 domain-containing protein [Spirochaetota bacterium]